MNRFGSALSTAPDVSAAVEECVTKARRTLGAGSIDLAVLFVSHDHQDSFEQLAENVQAEIQARHLVGCAGETIVGREQEQESGPALSLWLAQLPGATVESFRIDVEVREDEAGRNQIVLRGIPDIEVGNAAEVRERRLSMLLLGEPFTFPASEWLQQMNEAFPGLPVYGGMASGGSSQGANCLFHGSSSVREGAVGVLLEGLSVGHVVSQGCRPIGPSMVITKARENVIEEVAGQPTLVRLQSIYQEASGTDQEALRRALQGGGLHVGQVVDEHISQPDRGDFLVRNVVGSDPKSGALMIGDWARRGRTVRFHVRDASAADEDLRELLAGAHKRHDPAGALLFSCNGRGTRLFPEPHHDARCVGEEFQDLPVAGFFAQGEIGPVSGRNFLHGFTASVALFGRE